MIPPLPVLILKTGSYPVHHGGLGIIRSLGRSGIPVYTFAEDHLTPAGTSRYLKGSFVWKGRDLPKQEMLEALASAGKELRQPAVLIPTDDLGAILIAEESATLRQWFVFPDISAEVPRTLANKQMLDAMCRRLGVACSKTLVPTSLSDATEFAESVGFPLVVKPAAAWVKPRLKVSIVRTRQQLIDIWHSVASSQNPQLLIQEYIPRGEDWFFHGYCNGASDCLAGFTGMKLRSFPPDAGITTLGRSVTNDVLLGQAENMLKAISYAGIVDIDYRFDPRDRRYKLLDFNPRIGAQFRLFEDENGMDVVTALYRDLTGQTVRRARQVDGRVLVVEPDDLRASMKYFWRGELSVSSWLRSFRGRKEFAWFRRDDPLPLLMASARLAIGAACKRLRIWRLKFNITPNLAVMDQEWKPNKATPIAQYGFWSRLISVASPMWQYLVRPWSD